MMTMPGILGRLLVVILFVMTSCGSVLAEYVIYKTTRNMVTRKISLQAPSPQAFKVAYDIVLKYKWPTSIYTFYSDPNINLQQDEETSIRQELHKAFPKGDIDVAFIPTIIYEAAFLGRNVAPQQGLTDGQAVLEEILDTKWGTRLIDQKVLEVLQKVQDKDEKTQYLAILKYMYELNSRGKTLEIAQRVNMEICTFLNNNLKSIQSINLDDAPLQKKMDYPKTTQLKHIILGNPRPSWNLSAAISRYFNFWITKDGAWRGLINKNLNKRILLRVAQLEWKAHQQNQALIFRGTQQDSPLRLNTKDLYDKLKTPEMQQRENILRGKTPQITQRDIKPFSLSYGFSLLAGMAIDSGGNVYNYASFGGLGYALEIDKAQFFDRSRPSPRDLFWVPPLGTVFSFYGVDDLFHPRTTVGMTDSMKSVRFDANDYLNTQKSAVKIDVDQFFSYSPIVWVVGIDKRTSWDMKASALTNYIASHAVAFYDSKNSLVGGGSILSLFHADDLLFLREHQHKFKSTLNELRNKPPILKHVPPTTATP